MFDLLTVKAQQNLGSAVLSFTFEVPQRLQLAQVLAHADAAITETIQVTHDALEGAAWDTLLKTTSLTAEQDFAWRPDGKCVFEKGDKIKITCTDANVVAAETISVKIQFERL